MPDAAASQAAHASTVDMFVAAMTANAATVHGPVPRGGAARAIVELALAAGGSTDPVAVATGDPLVAELGLVDALRRAGVDVLAPDDPSWRERVAGAAAGITGAVAAVAETGTVAVACGVDRPRTTSLVPPTHLCVLRTITVTDTLEAALAGVLESGLPSNLVWISGPSRTGDLQMTITMGVHGPKRVDVILVDD